MTELANGASIESFVPIEIEVKHLPPIKVEDLPDYVKEKRANGDLKTQFQVSKLYNSAENKGT